MGLFKSSQEKQAEKLQKMMRKYHLENIDPKYSDAVKDIQHELLGTGLGELGVKLAMPDITKALPIYYLRTLIEQNWIIIRQLDDIEKNLKR